MLTWLMLIAFAVGGAAEPMEASLCDVWPLAAGNVWIILPFVAGTGSSISVLAQEDHNGCMVWTMVFYTHGFVDHSTLAYWVRLDG